MILPDIRPAGCQANLKELVIYYHNISPGQNPSSLQKKYEHPHIFSVP
jgi:hypothetical protein